MVYELEHPAGTSDEEVRYREKAFLKAQLLYRMKMGTAVKTRIEY